MRRLEMLSNTIFGVAMTLLAYDLPKASSFKSAPEWIDLVRVYAQPVIALAISFVVAGLFWFSHHRRLAVAPEGGRGVVFLNLFFLLSIIILPVTNGLYGAYRLDGVLAVLYGFHLTIIAALNAVLWVLALRGHSDPRLLATALFRCSCSYLGRPWRCWPRELHSSSGAWLSWRRLRVGSPHVVLARRHGLIASGADAKPSARSLSTTGLPLRQSSAPSFPEIPCAAGRAGSAGGTTV